MRRFKRLICVRGVLCVGTLLLFGTVLLNRLPPAVILTRGWPSSCSARETIVNLGYVTRGLGLDAVLLGCFFALLVPFSGIGIDGDGICCFWKGMANFVANFVLCRNALVRCSIEWTRWCA